MEHYTAQVSWQNYIAVQVVEAEIEEAEAEADVEVEKAKVMLNSEKKVTEARWHRDASKEVQDLREKYLTAKARRKYLTIMMENRERCANILSRELTRRIGRESNDRRGHRMGGG